MRNRVILALLLVLGGCLTVSAQAGKPALITREALLDRLEVLERDRAQVIANINAYDGAIQECKYWLEQLELAEKEKKEQEQEEVKEETKMGKYNPEDHEYPKWMYKGAVPKLVKDAEQEKALGAGWKDTPAHKDMPAVQEAVKPKRQKVAEQREKRKQHAAKVSAAAGVD